jgi:D-serine deaminase-like pyridoxal phosphate-dependent protein
MLSAIEKPTLIIDEQKCRSNIDVMVARAKASGVQLRPHFKTHQSLIVGRWFRDYGLESITVSSSTMAEKFAADGWSDITIAFPANIREAENYNRLAEQLSLKLLVDAKEVIDRLDQLLVHHTGLFLEIDLGYQRSGISHTNISEIDACLDAIRHSDKLTFLGFLTHSGNTYHTKSKEEIRQIHDHASLELNNLKARYTADYDNITLSIGDTPSCSVMETINNVDEIRPGNFVFYDLMQYQLGSCQLEDIAVCAACPVCGIYPERNEILIYGGAVHLSKEYLEGPPHSYGMVVNFNKHGWTKPLEGTVLKSLSQEHGIIKTTPALLKQVKHGDLLGILPVHSCLTANLLRDDVMII